MTAYEVVARQVKADRIVRALEAHGATPSQVAALDDGERARVALVAGTRRPSEDTWALVVELFTQRARYSASTLAAMAADEAEGLAVCDLCGEGTDHSHPVEAYGFPEVVA